MSSSNASSATRSRHIRRYRTLLLLAGVLAAMAWGAPPTGNTVAARTDAATATTPRNIHFFPSIPYEKAHPTACTTTCALMTFHGGTVQHAEKDYFIFWIPSGHYMPPSYRSGLNTWLADVAGDDYLPGDVFAVAQQYYDLTGPGSTQSFVPYAITSGAAIVDTDALPASSCTDSPAPVCIDDAQLRAEVQHVITAHSLPQNRNTQYIVFTPVNVGSCFTSTSSSCAYSQYCGYHGFFTGTAGQIVYANMPWLYGTSGCDVNMAFGTGFANGSAIDPEVGVLSHELIETMTDPNLNAWFDSSGNEIGDKCAYIYGGGGYGSMTGLANNGLGFWNQGLVADEYLLQMEFSNRNSNGTSTGCVSSDSDTQPVVTISIVPNPPVHGSSAKFTANITDPYGVNLVQWTFGDGTTATGNPVNHTYATAGAKTVTVIVTDKHGNEKKVVETITVS